jgi:hypothetical protein
LCCDSFQGIVCSGVAYYVQGLVSRQRGPVFVTAFNPLCMIVTSVMGSIILKEQITLGRYGYYETCSPRAVYAWFYMLNLYIISRYF